MLWRLTCVECRATIKEEPVIDDGKTVSLFIPLKPEFPSDVEIECPKCHKKSVYSRAQFALDAFGSATAA